MGAAAALESLCRGRIHDAIHPPDLRSARYPESEPQGLASGMPKLPRTIDSRVVRRIDGRIDARIHGRIDHRRVTSSAPTDTA